MIFARQFRYTISKIEKNGKNSRNINSYKEISQNSTFEYVPNHTEIIEMVKTLPSISFNTITTPSIQSIVNNAWILKFYISTDCFMGCNILKIGSWLMNILIDTKVTCNGQFIEVTFWDNSRYERDTSLNFNYVFYKELYMIQLKFQMDWNNYEGTLSNGTTKTSIQFLLVTIRLMDRNYTFKCSIVICVIRILKNIQPVQYNGKNFVMLCSRIINVGSAKSTINNAWILKFYISIDCFMGYNILKIGSWLMNILIDTKVTRNCQFIEVTFWDNSRYERDTSLNFNYVFYKELYMIQLKFQMDWNNYEGTLSNGTTKTSIQFLLVTIRLMDRKKHKMTLTLQMVDLKNEILKANEKINRQC